LGEKRLRRLADKYGKWLSLSAKDIDKANYWFNKHGAKAVLLCRLVPGVRTVISLPAGISQMAIAPFLIFSSIGTTLWIIILTALGYFLGNNYSLVDDYLGHVSKVVLIGLVGVFVVWVLNRKTQLKATRQKARLR
jgi:membrane protein DedA with SNARE-associated domain